MTALFGAVDRMLDVAFHYNFTPTPLYLIPISIAAWFGGLPLGLLVSVPALLLESWLSLKSIKIHHPNSAIITEALSLLIAAEMLGAVLIVSRLRSYVRKYHHFASVDELTECLNARAFRHECEIAIERLKRSKDAHLSVMYIDVDDFKIVNDEKGHKHGDAALKTLGEALRTSVRLVDVVGRVGGDEFAVLLPDAEEADLPLIIGRIKAALVQLEFPTTISIGYVTYPPGVPKDLDAVFHLADQRMYAAKKARKQR
jgi:diguanylate cyclase (GGDEF)-like protein